MKKKILLNIFFLGSSQVMASVLAIVYAAVVPTYLGPTNFGFLTLLGALVGIISVISNFGTRLFIVREIASNEEKGVGLIGPALLTNALLSVVCWIVVITFLLLTDKDTTFLTVAIIVGITNILIALSNPLNAALQGIDKMHFSFVSVLVEKGFGTLLVVLVAIFDLGIIYVVGVDLLLAFTMIPLILWWATRHFKIQLTKNYQLYKYLLKGGLAFFIVDIAFNIYVNLDSVLLSFFTNDTVVGYYGVPTRLFGTLLTAPSIVASAVLPSLSRLNGDNNQKSTAKNLERLTIQFFICLSIPMAVGTTVIAEPLIRDIYGSQFNESISPMILLAWTCVPTYLGMALFQVLAGQGLQGRWTKMMGLAGVVNLLLNVFFIPFFQHTQSNGAIGAALSLLLTEVVIGLFGIRQIEPGIINGQIYLSFLKSLLAAAIMGVVIFPLQHTFILLPVVLGGIVYGLLIVWFFNLSGFIKKAFVELPRNLRKVTAGKQELNVEEQPKEEESYNKI